MSTAAVNDDDADVEFSHLTEPKMPGLWKLGPAASLFLIIACVVMLALLIFSLLAAVIWTVLALVIVAPAAFPTKDGYGRYEVILRRTLFRRAEASGRTVLHQGLGGRVKDQECRLPSLAAGTKLFSSHDVQGREFGIIYWPDAQLYSVVIESYPEGFTGLDKSTSDRLTAMWGAWLATLHRTEEIVGASVTIESSPDTGQRLEQNIRRGQVDAERSNKFSRAVSAELIPTYNTGSPLLRARTTVTLSAVSIEGDDDEKGVVRSAEEMKTLLGNMLPEWSSGLIYTGAGPSTPCTCQEITDHTRQAFDPSLVEWIDAAQSGMGSSDPEEAADGTGLTWNQAGPTSMVNRYDHIEHDGWFSRSWQMRRAPRGVFFNRTLQRLLAPHPDVRHKRVTLLYKPETAEVSITAAENDVKKAMFKATQNKRMRALQGSELEAAQHVAKQTAKGSPLVCLGMVVTVTVRNREELKRASRAVRSGMSAAADINMRLPRGSQDVSFLTSLPIGLTPHAQKTAPNAKEQSA